VKVGVLKFVANKLLKKSVKLSVNACFFSYIVGCSASVMNFFFVNKYW